MKQKLMVLAACFWATGAFAQKPGHPGKIELPTPHIQPLKPADLEITGAELVSASVNPTNKVMYVVMRITIINHGQVTAPASNMKAFIQNIYSHPTDFVQFSGFVPFQALTGGQSATSTVTFKEMSRGILQTSSFNIKIMADAGAEVAESNETNNFSPVIRVNPH